MKKFFLITGLFLFLSPLIINAQGHDSVFEATVIEVLQERQLEAADGTVFHQQNLRLIGNEGDYEGKEFVVEGISDLEVVESNIYKEGDRVMVIRSMGPAGEEHFFVTDYIRRTPLAWLTIAFILAVLAVARLKGFRALIVLFATFILIIQVMIPLLLQGYNPLLVSILGALIIGAMAIFGTEGISKKSVVSYVSMVLSFVFVLFFSVVFTKLGRLTGVSEEAAMLLSFSQGDLNLQGLLLAGIIIGSVGVLDDVVISQVSTVKEIIKADPKQSKLETFKGAMRVGTDHINAMVNTLFLAYAGAALPLLVLFNIKEVPFVTFSQVINNELIASEIVRTLSGSIGLVLSVPLATYIAVRAFKKKLV